MIRTLSDFSFISRVNIFFVFSYGFVFLFSRFFKYDSFLMERVLFLFSSFIFCLVSLLYFLCYGIKFRKSKILFFLFFFFSFFLFIIINFKSEYPAPTLFFVNISLLFFCGFFSKKNNSIGISNGKVWVVWFWFYIIISFFLYLIGSPDFYQQGNRFLAFGVSPTTFTIWLLSVYLLAYVDFFNSNRKPSIGVVLGLLATSFFVYVSGTRVNLVFCLFVGFFVFFKPFFIYKYIRFFISIFFLIFVSFSYHIFGYLIYEFGGEALSYRFEGGVDDSFRTRLVFFNLIYDEIFKSDLVPILFGHGSDASRSYLSDVFGLDTYPHNDVLRLIYDYGVVFSFLFLFLVCCFSFSSPFSFVFVCLYIISFMHNMIFSPYLFMLLIISSLFFSCDKDQCCE